MIEFGSWLQGTPVSLTIQSVPWIIPLLQSIHILTIGVVFISILMIALRVFGAVRADQKFGTVARRFWPWIVYGLIVMAVTGLLLIVAEPVRQFTSTSFWLKMALLLIGVLSALAIRLTLGRARLDPEYDRAFGARSKTAAGAAVALWLAIIFLGRAIAYDVEIWGPLSLAWHG